MTKPATAHDAPSVFLAGPVHAPGAFDHRTVSQEYRSQLRAIMEGAGGAVMDPMATLPVPLGPIDLAGARLAFSGILSAIERANLVVAYLPIESMGAAIEIHHAALHRVPIALITPLGERWVLKALATVIYGSIDDFAREFAGELTVRGYLERIVASTSVE